MADEALQVENDLEFVRLLSRETGVSEEQILSIMQLVGRDRSSIIREALVLKQSS